VRACSQPQGMFLRFETRRSGVHRSSLVVSMRESDAATCLSLVRPRAARAVVWAVERKSTESVRQAAGLRGFERAADEEGRAAYEADDDGGGGTE
jgi:hypothetical protein